MPGIRSSLTYRRPATFADNRGSSRGGALPFDAAREARARTAVRMRACSLSAFRWSAPSLRHVAGSCATLLGRLDLERVGKVLHARGSLDEFGNLRLLRGGTNLTLHRDDAVVDVEVDVTIT